MNASPACPGDGAKFKAVRSGPQPTLRRIQRRLSSKQQADLVADYQAGSSQRHLATQYGIHVSTVEAILTRTGTPRRTAGPSPDRTALIRRLYEEQQLSCARIAEHLSCDPTTIWNALRRHGVRLRDTTGRP